jgi:chemotaxis signal transduction protein
MFMSSNPLRSRRFAQRQSEKIHSLITFRLAEVTFALPLDAALQVFPLNCPQSTPQDPTAYQTCFQEQDLKVIDFGDRWFNQSSVKGVKSLSVLVVQNREGDRLGILLPSPPSIHHVPESGFSPLVVELELIPCLGRQQVNIGDSQWGYWVDVERLLTVAV